MAITDQTLEVKKTRADGSRVTVSVPMRHSDLMEFCRSPIELIWEEWLIRLGVRHKTSQPQLYSRYRDTKKIKLDRKLDFPDHRFLVFGDEPPVKNGISIRARTKDGSGNA